jgi:hypothetical protein
VFAHPVIGVATPTVSLTLSARYRGGGYDPGWQDKEGRGRTAHGFGSKATRILGFREFDFRREACFYGVGLR